MKAKPTIFVGSSSERLKVVDLIAKGLKKATRIRRWDRNVFLPGDFALESLEKAMKESDFAIFVFAGDDIVKWRRNINAAPRDNVILEIGMAIGVLGRNRLLLLYSDKDRAKIPTDLFGFNYVPLKDKVDSVGAVREACEVIQQYLISADLRLLPSDSEHMVTHRQRSDFSRNFASKTIHTFDTFSGDLSWLHADLPTYRELAKRSVRIRFLTDTPDSPVIREAKRCGMSFRQYPSNSEARIKASLSDAASEGDARALVVQKVLVADDRRPGPYDYRMKIYAGPKEYGVISALNSYFADLFARGKAL